MILKLSITPQAKASVQNDTWLPAESSSIPASNISNNISEQEAITLAICFMHGQYFLKEGDKWVVLSNQKQLDINNSCITLNLEPLPNPSSFKKTMIPNHRRSKLNASISQPLSSSPEFKLLDTSLFTATGKDPLNFLKKSTALGSLKNRLSNLFTTNDEK